MHVCLQDLCAKTSAFFSHQCQCQDFNFLLCINVLLVLPLFSLNSFWGNLWLSPTLSPFWSRNSSVLFSLQLIFLGEFFSDTILLIPNALYLKCTAGISFSFLSKHSKKNSLFVFSCLRNGKVVKYCCHTRKISLTMNRFECGRVAFVRERNEPTNMSFFRFVSLSCFSFTRQSLISFHSIWNLCHLFSFYHLPMCLILSTSTIHFRHNFTTMAVATWPYKENRTSDTTET